MQVERQGGSLVMSVDFELAWGVFDRPHLTRYRRHLAGAREVVARAIDLFTAQGVAATWATVGLLFCESRAEALELFESHWSQSAVARPAAWDRLREAGPTALPPAHAFAPDLVDRIAAAPGQELASHTFSHPRGDRPALPVDYPAELDAAVAVAARRGQRLESITFPDDQVPDEHLPTCATRGFRACRVPARIDLDQWPWGLRQAGRVACWVTPALATASRRPVRHSSGLVTVPASARIPPWDRRWGPTRLVQLQRAMTAAALADRAVHFWWHPHNFGADPDANLNQLGLIVEHARRLADETGFTSESMACYRRAACPANQPAAAESA